MTIKQLGGVFGRNPTFNDVTIEGQLTFEGDIDVNSDLKVSGDLDVTGDAIVENLGVNVSSITSGYRVDVYEPTENGMNIQAGNAGADKILSLGSPSTADKIVFTAGGDIDMTIGGGDIIFKSGNGIDFSATAGTGTSELFDDYEEGTWTPAITFGGASVGIVYTQQEASYTKIGRQVFVNLVIRLSSKGTSTGSMVITGLPFAKSSSTDFGHIFCGTIANAASLNSMPFGGINEGATTIAVRHLNDPNGSGASDPQLTNTNVNNFLVIGMSGVYETS